MTGVGQARTFRQVIASGERMTLGRALVLVRAAALAVDALHAHQVVHGSLEPSAFRLDAEDHVTLLPPPDAPAPARQPGDAAPLGARPSRPLRSSADAATAREYWSPQRRAGEPARAVG